MWGAKQRVELHHTAMTRAKSPLGITDRYGAAPPKWHCQSPSQKKGYKNSKYKIEPNLN